METLQLKTEYKYERDRLNSLCEKWQDILNKSSKGSFSEDTRGAILSVIGQSRLLLNKKMKQFEKLLSDFDCEDENVPLITIEDLQGFWELVMIQVTELNARFADLEIKKVPSSEVLQRSSKSSGTSHQKINTHSRYGDH